MLFNDLAVIQELFVFKRTNVFFVVKMLEVVQLFLPEAPYDLPVLIVLNLLLPLRVSLVQLVDPVLHFLLVGLVVQLDFVHFFLLEHAFLLDFLLLLFVELFEVLTLGISFHQELFPDLVFGVLFLFVEGL